MFHLLARKIYFCLFLAVAGCSMLLAAPPVRAQPDRAGQAELRNALRRLLREEPELILDLLRENSEAVLDIAQEGSDQRRSRLFLNQWQADLKVPKSVKLDGRPQKGKAGAPVTIVAFTDFTCLYCQQGEALLDRIFKAYPDQVRVVYKSLPLSSHPGSVEAAQFMLAAYLQDKDKSWGLFEGFFANRDQILGKSGDTYLRSAASTLKFDMTRLLNDAKGRKVKTMLQEDEADAQVLKVQGTPFFLVNNLVIRGVIQEKLFREAVNMALNAAGAQGADAR